MHDMGTLNVDPRQTRPLDSSMDSSAAVWMISSKRGHRAPSYTLHLAYRMRLRCGYLCPLGMLPDVLPNHDDGDDDDDDAHEFMTQS